MKTLITLLLSALAFAAFAADVSVEWDANTEPNVSYRLYSGTESRDYTKLLDLTNTTGTLTNVQPGVRYYVSVTAVDPSGLESAFSDEISFTIPAKPGRLRIKIQAQQSADLREWRDAGEHIQFLADADAQFIRTALKLERNE